MSGIRPRVTLPAEALERPPHAPDGDPSQREAEYARLLRRARRRTWLVMLAGLLLLGAGGADIVTADSGGLVLAGVIPLVLGLAACVLAERRLARLAYAARPRRGRRAIPGDAPRSPEADRVGWARMAWFDFSHGGSDGGGAGFWDGFGGGDSGGGGGDGGGG